MDMGMMDGLPCGIATVHTYVETQHRPVGIYDHLPDFIHEDADGSPLRIAQIEPGRPCTLLAPMTPASVRVLERITSMFDEPSSPHSESKADP
jgi:hypothetical protein